MITQRASVLALTIASLVGMTLGSSACSSNEPTRDVPAVPPAPPPPPPAPADAGPAAIDFSPLAATIEAERQKLGAPGVSVIVLHKGKVVLSQGFGTRAGSDTPIKTSTLFRVSSVAKTWTALAAMKLVEDGKISLDTKVVDRIPGFAVSGSSPQAAEVTLRNLLAHTSGLYDGVASDADLGPKDDAMLERWVTSPAFQSTFYFMTPPGKTFNYTNVGYGIAGQMLERASGKRHRETLRDAVLAPLGMNRVLCTPEEVQADGDFTNGKGEVMIIDPAVDWSPLNYAHGGGSACHASADDLAKLARFLLEGDPRVASAESLALMKTRSGESDQPWVANLYRNYGYGLGLHVIDGLAIDGIYHPMNIIGNDGNGRGYAAMMELVPERELAFIALANGNDAYFDQSFVHAVKLAGLPAPAPKPAMGVDPTLYPSFVGSYHEPRVLKDIVIRQVGAKLFADISGLAISGRELTPDHGTGFELLDVRTEQGYYDHFVRFIPDASGKIALLRNRYWVANRLP
jgi:CubicO group peptidase (beta-lactamase class C family)